MPLEKRLFIAAVGDIHGRFHRVDEWLRQLEEARGRELDFTLAVGDVEAFPNPESPLRKGSKKALPAEFQEFAVGRRRMVRPMYFSGGNNEDFRGLHGIQGGGPLSEDLHYLGRAGVRKLKGLQVGWLSGIFAPKHFENPLAEPKDAATSKQAGYFRRADLQQLEGASADLLMVHEWPRGIVPRVAPPPAGLRAFKFPWIGNAVTRTLVGHVKPQWVLCGHSHTPFAATLPPSIRIACLDQAAKPEGAIFWIEWEGGEAVAAGWGITGAVAWTQDAPWDYRSAPATPPGA